MGSNKQLLANFHHKSFPARAYKTRISVITLLTTHQILTSLKGVRLIRINTERDRLHTVFSEREKMTLRETVSRLKSVYNEQHKVKRSAILTSINFRYNWNTKVFKENYKLQALIN